MYTEALLGEFISSQTRSLLAAPGPHPATRLRGLSFAMPTSLADTQRSKIGALAQKIANWPQKFQNSLSCGIPILRRAAGPLRY